MEGHEPRHFGPESLLGTTVLSCCSVALSPALAFAYWFLLHKVKTDISAGSVNSLVRCPFLEKRIQVWLKELILYLLDNWIGLNGVASLQSVLQGRSWEGQLSPRLHSTTVGYAVLPSPVGEQQIPEFGQHTANPARGRRRICLNWDVVTSAIASGETSSGIFFLSPLCQTSYTAPTSYRAGRRWELGLWKSSNLHNSGKSWEYLLQKEKV